MTPCRRATAGLAAAAVALSGCSVVPPASSPQPTASAPATATADPAVDLTQPGVAHALVTELLATAGARRAVMVTVAERDASVAVVKNGQAQTWAYRQGRIQQVESDINYVAQATFDPDEFDLSDVGALFRAARAVSGSDARPELQVVDYSGGSVAMTVSTNPESRTVFFHPDGTLLPTLDFTSAWGLEAGHADAVGPRGVAQAVGFGSALGVYLDTPATTAGTVVRRQRTARTPVIVTSRTEQSTLRAFDSGLVRPAVVWAVLERLHEDGSFTLDQAWSCVADDRAGTGTPRLYFTVGARSFVTDLLGNVMD